MRMIIDVMGGDYAPLSPLAGVQAVCRQAGADMILVGNRDVIRKTAAEIGLDIEGMTIVDTKTVVNMNDAPLTAFREKKDSSMMTGLAMLSRGEGDAFVSAGNTGALFTGATLLVKRADGVKRAAIGTVIPGDRPFLLLDAGANLNVTAEYLEQFARMGSAYMKRMYGIPSPAVGLLNNGTEDCKGNPLQIEANTRLKACSVINYVGNVEGNSAMLGACDVLVTDGFTGNIFLKTVEGSCRLLLGELKAAYMKNIRGRLSALLFRNSLGELKQKFSPAKYGGSPILGLAKPVIKAHGSSDAEAFGNAILQAVSYVKSGIGGEISEEMIDGKAGL